MPPPTPSANSFRVAAASAAAPTLATPTSTTGFTAFVLDRVAHNPFLIGETPRSLSAASGGVAAATLDPAQRAVLLHPAVPTNDTASATAVTSLLQRALVDAPLLPTGGSHLLHEHVWSNFVACAEAAKQVGCYKKALQLSAARASREAEPTPGKESGSGADVNTSDAGDDPSRVKGALGLPPLASDPKPADSPQPPLSLPSASSSSSPQAGNSNSANSLLSPEELSVSFAPDVLQTRLAQAQARLVEVKIALQRGLARLRRVAVSLHTYDATPIEELRRQRQATAQELVTPLKVLPMQSEGGTTPPAVVESEQDRKRPRTAE
ncbi:hypothetical protein ABL78_6553 [Leptomonas seymouri]|uniref:Uncharacterized protein n=1 Tax=Leptomonas seymouri TaxID=5684 RepID=A0A0N1I0N8_LEPSE|nr:hypothetical protein ABL78_6553 [Leptomonas seymouri]|eukprot:KPI84392.1 hypothetical protein ABL78_6553 [Leptomonas seymouri]